jgi:serine/threonine protein kinase
MATPQGSPSEVPWGAMAGPARDSKPVVSLGDGRYHLHSRIDAGGMAAVYRVHDHKLNVDRAMKVLMPEWARNPKIRQRFESEARTMARLEHPNLVRIYDVGVEADLPYLVMELVTGGSLQRWIEAHGAMPPRMAIEATCQLASALVAVHAAGVVHRDIKPHNVLIAEPGTCKLTDFGIAHLGEGGSTKTGTQLGTQGYMAPEQRADAKSVDGRADLYGVGATLYALLTGQPAHDVFLSVERNGLSELPRWTHDVIRNTVAYAKEERYRDAESLLEALHEALSTAPDAPALPRDFLVAMPAEGQPFDIEQDEIFQLLARGDTRTPDHNSTPTPAASASALPYYMPKPTRARRSISEAPGDEAEPDWIAQSEPSSGRFEAVIGANVPVRQTPVASTPTRASTPPRPTPVPPARLAATPLPPTHVPDPNLRLLTPRIPTPAPPPTRPTPAVVITEPEGDSNLLVWLLAPVVVVLFGVLLLVLLAGGIVSMKSRSVNAAEHGALEQRELLYGTLIEEGGAVQLFKQAGVPTAALEESFLQFQDTKAEPARRDAALAYSDALDDEARRWLSAEGGTISQTEATHAARKIVAREQAVQDAEQVWVAAGSGLVAQVVIGLGFSKAPPPAPTKAE